jgi:hypothetical protein
LEIHCENCDARFVAYYGTEENVDTETLDVLTRRSGEEIRAAPEGAEEKTETRCQLAAFTPAGALRKKKPFTPERIGG